MAAQMIRVMAEMLNGPTTIQIATVCLAVSVSYIVAPPSYINCSPMYHRTQMAPQTMTAKPLRQKSPKITAASLTVLAFMCSSFRLAFRLATGPTALLKVYTKTG